MSRPHCINSLRKRFYVWWAVMEARAGDAKVIEHFVLQDRSQYIYISLSLSLSLSISVYEGKTIWALSLQISPCEIDWLESTIILSDFTLHSLYILLSNDWKPLNSKYLHHVNILKRLIQSKYTTTTVLYRSIISTSYKN